MKEFIPVVVCGDKNVEIGLHVTLYSLLEKSSAKYHKIYFINEGYTKEDLSNLSKSLNPFSGRYEIIPVGVSSVIFDKYKGLHGNKMAYSKLVIPDLIPEDKMIVFLDLDIVVNIDVKKLYKEELLGDHIIAGNEERLMGDTHEWNLYQSFGFDKNASYFNSGVMLINLKKWRTGNFTQKCLLFAEENNSKLKTADQTVLNYVFYRDFSLLPDKFNIRIDNNISYKKYIEKEGIFHFYGRPKPWDLFAEFVHPQYKLYKPVLDNTIFHNYKSYKNINSKNRAKFFITYKSYIRALLRL